MTQKGIDRKVKGCREKKYEVAKRRRKRCCCQLPLGIKK
jgi:hypothetical protein